MNHFHVFYSRYVPVHTKGATWKEEAVIMWSEINKIRKPCSDWLLHNWGTLTCSLHILVLHNSLFFSLLQQHPFSVVPDTIEAILCLNGLKFKAHLVFGPILNGKCQKKMPALVNNGVVRNCFEKLSWEILRLFNRIDFVAICLEKFKLLATAQCWRAWLLYSVDLKDGLPLFVLESKLRRRSSSWSLCLWNQACSDQRRHALL